MNANKRRSRPGEELGFQVVDGHVHIGGPPERRGSVGDILALMRKAADLGIAALFHSGHAPYSLPWEIGEVAELFPSVPVIMDHMGLQWMGYVDAAIRVAKRLPNVVLGTTGMVFHSKIRQAVHEVGADRVVFGSDAPMVHPGPEILRVLAAELTPDEERMVLRDNMLRLVRLSGR